MYLIEQCYVTPSKCTPERRARSRQWIHDQLSLCNRCRHSRRSTSSQRWSTHTPSMSNSENSQIHSMDHQISQPLMQCIVTRSGIQLMDMLTRWTNPAAANQTLRNIVHIWARRIALLVRSRLKYCKISGNAINRKALRKRKPRVERERGVK